MVKLSAVYHKRAAESFKFNCEITKPFGELDHCLSWCKQQLKTEWRWELLDVSSDQRPGRYKFYFDNESEFLAFVMKWR